MMVEDWRLATEVSMNGAVMTEDVGYSVSAAARRIGVAASTLRTWDRRYGISPSMRTAGDHRRYTLEDLDLLERMHQLMVGGMPPGDAARAAAAGAGLAGPAEFDEVAADVVQLRPSADYQRSLERAATGLDSNAASDIIRRCIDGNGVVWAWEEVIAPVLRTIGARSAGGGDGDGIDVEHHLSHIVIRELVRQAEVREPVNPRPVLLAAAADEEHTLPLFALSAALAERSIACRVLGGRTPDGALAAAVRRTGPVAVFIWAQSCPATDLEHAVPTTRPAAAVFVGGPGWAGVDRPAETAYPQQLAEAVTGIACAARGQQG